MPTPTLKSLNPATGEILRELPAHTPEQTQAAIGRAAHAFQKHRLRPIAERAHFLVRAAELLEARKEYWGELLTREMGKTRQAAIDETLKCAKTLRYYAEHGARMLADETVPDDGDKKRRVVYQPLGPVLAIMPWNFPFWQAFRAAGPALLAGNTMLLKHASNVPQSALAIEEIFQEAGLRDCEFQTLLIGSRDVAAVISDDRIRGVTLTGSDTVGAEVASLAGKHLKKVVLELGGSDPFIVMPSTDLASTVQAAIKARTINNGESCVAAKRFIVHESIAEEFERRFTDGMRALKVGDPLKPETQIGPLATPAIRDSLAEQVERTVKAGARVLCGGKVIPGPGNFYEPTVLTQITKESPAWHEEFFGPVALVIRARDLTHAVAIANDNPYGLGSSLWSTDEREHAEFIRDIEAGQAFINTPVASDPAIPFGGVKRSGYGRELSAHGIREFTNVKSVVVAPGAQAEKPKAE